MREISWQPTSVSAAETGTKTSIHKSILENNNLRSSLRRPLSPSSSCQATPGYKTAAWVAGVMSAPLGAGRGRANTRIRGSSRGATRARDPRNGSSKSHVPRQPPAGPSARAENHLHSRAASRGNHVRNKSWRNPTQSSSTVTNHAQKPSTTKLEPWRNAKTEDPANYKRRMNELRETVRYTFLLLLTSRPLSDSCPWAGLLAFKKTCNRT